MDAKVKKGRIVKKTANEKASTPFQRMKRYRQKVELDKLIIELREKSKRLGEAANNKIRIEDNPLPIELDILQKVSNGLKGVISPVGEELKQKCSQFGAQKNLLKEAENFFNEADRLENNYVTITDVINEQISLTEVIDRNHNNFYMVGIEDESFPIFYEDEYFMIKHIKENPDQYDFNMAWSDCVDMYMKKLRRGTLNKKMKQSQPTSTVTRASIEADNGNSIDSEVIGDWQPMIQERAVSALVKEESEVIDFSGTDIVTPFFEGLQEDNGEVQCAQEADVYIGGQSDDSLDVVGTESDDEYAFFKRTKLSFTQPENAVDDLMPTVGTDSDEDNDAVATNFIEGEDDACNSILENELEESFESLSSQDEIDIPPDADFDDSALCSAFSSMSIKKFSLSELIRAQREEDKIEDLLDKNEMTANRYLAIVARHGVSNDAADDIWNFVRAMDVDRRMKSFKTILNRVKKELPNVKMKFELRNKDSNERIIHEGTVYPEKTYPSSKYEKLCEWTTSAIKDLYEFHLKIHNKKRRYPIKRQKVFDLAVDGVPLSNSGIDKMDLACVRFFGCKTVYMSGAFIYRDGFGISLNDCIEALLDAAKREGFKLNVVIADAPARAKLKCLKGHAGYCSCDRCLAVGVYLKKMVFPPTTMSYKHRSMPEWLRHVDLAQADKRNGQEVNDSMTFGVHGRSPLLTIDGFDLIENVPIEPMHNLLLGMARGIICEIVNPRRLGSKTYSARTTELMQEFDQRWTKLRIPSEFTRRPRAMKSGLIHFKSSEYLAITVAGFLNFGRALIGEYNRKYRKVWYYFSYLVRSVFFDDKMYSEICKKVNLSELMQTFYFMYENVFGKEKCSFNLHLFSHLRETRKKHRLSQISAEPFESFYGFIKRLIVNNTKSFTKQVMQKSLIASISQHNCERTVNINMKNTRANRQDNLIYTNDRSFYEVVGIEGKNSYRCIKIITSKYRNSDVFNLDFSLVGVESFKKYDSEEVIISKDKIVGKAIKDGNIMIAIPIDALHS